MHELFLELFPYLILLYLLDGVALIHPGQRFFLSHWGGRFRPVEWATVIFNPFPLGQSITTYELGLIPTAMGIYTFTPDSTQTREHYQAVAFHFIAYTAIDTITLDGAKLQVNQTTVCTTASTQQAQRLAALLKMVKSAPVEQRTSAIQQYLSETQDLVALQQRHADAEAAVRLLRPWCLLFFVTLFAMLPLLLYGTHWLALFLPNVLLLLGLTYSVCLLLTIYLHRQLHQTTWIATLLAQLGLIFSPVSAIRAIDHLTRTLYSDYAAITVAALLLPAPAFAQQLRYELHRASCAKALQQSIDWQEFWTMRQQKLERLGEQRGLTVAAIFAAPAQQDKSAAAYCPVCHSEYRSGFAFCRDCEVALQSFSVSKARSDTVKSVA